MIIRKMRACFGCLNSAELELHEGLNLITAPNESGKSTWCAFIRAMLYGIDSSQRARGSTKPDKLKYAPWSGAAMGGEMDISHEGRDITLRRSTRSAAAPMREFSAVYTGTAQPVAGLDAANVGEALTGMPRAVFESSVFIHQTALGVSGSPELEKRINAIISTGDEDTASFTDAEARLRAWLRKRRHKRSGAIPAIEAEIADTRAALEAVASVSGERERLRELLRAAESGESTPPPHQDQPAAQLETLRQIFERLERRQAEALEKAMRAESEAERGYFGGMSASEALFEAAKDAQTLTELRAKVPGYAPICILAALVVLCAFCCALSGHIAFYIAGSAAVIAAIVLLALRNGKRREAAANAFAIVCRYNATDGEGIMAVAEEHVRACAAAEAANAALLEAENEAEAARAALRRAERELLRPVTESESRCGELSRRLAQTEGRLGAMGDPTATKAKLEELESRRAELEEQYEAISLAIEVLGEANARLQQRFSPALGRRAGEIMAQLTGGKYTQLSFDRNLNAEARCSGDSLAREAAFLSEGTADQLYLALRLAICELALPEDSSCPLVLDDALINFDDERMGYALELLREIARERQVIIFSCQEREKKYLES